MHTHLGTKIHCLNSESNKSSHLYKFLSIMDTITCWTSLIDGMKSVILHLFYISGDCVGLQKLQGSKEINGAPESCISMWVLHRWRHTCHSFLRHTGHPLGPLHRRDPKSVQVRWDCVVITGLFSRTVDCADYKSVKPLNMAWSFITLSP